MSSEPREDKFLEMTERPLPEEFNAAFVQVLDELLSAVNNIDHRIKNQNEAIRPPTGYYGLLNRISQLRKMTGNNHNLSDEDIDKIAERVWKEMAPVMMVQQMTLAVIAGQLADEMNTDIEYLKTLPRDKAEDIMARYKSLNEVGHWCTKQVESIKENSGIYENEDADESD